MRWVVSVGAVLALHACGSAPVDEARSSASSVATISKEVSTTVAPTVVAAVTPVATSGPSPTSLPPSTSRTSAGHRPSCSTYYRQSVTVPPNEGPILTFTTPGSLEAAFADLHLTATYSDDGFESPSLNVRVETLPDGALVFASLYQFVDPTVDLNVFSASGQGFTGLIYVYNPASASELQFFCSAG